MLTIYTVGHSNHALEHFLKLLESHNIKQLVDVRTIPQSRFNPQFGQVALSKSLKEIDIEYLHLPELGGLRKPLKDSINTFWRNQSFRGYADYMQTPKFAQALEKLLGLAKEKTSAIMCAEGVPAQCHRSLISDALTLKKVRVRHILKDNQVNLHLLHPYVRTRQGKICYPADNLF